MGYSSTNVILNDGTNILNIMQYDDAVGGSTKGIMAMGNYGGAARFLHIDSLGNLQIDVLSGTIDTVTSVGTVTTVTTVGSIANNVTVYNQDNSTHKKSITYARENNTGGENLWDTKTFGIACHGAYDNGGSLENMILRMGLTGSLLVYDAGADKLSTLVLLEDSVHVTGTAGLMPLAVRKDTLVALAGDGDYHPFEVNQHGALYTVNVDPNDPARVGTFDTKFRAPLVIEIGHFQIHSGNNYYREYLNDTASGAHISFAFRTPVTTRIHLTWEWTSEAGATFLIKEGPTWTTGTGDVVVPINNERASANTSLMEEDDSATPGWTANGILENVTETGVSPTIIRKQQAISGGVGPFSAGGGAGGSRKELVLKENTTYIIELTNDDGSPAFLTLLLDWYEMVPT